MLPVTWNRVEQYVNVTSVTLVLWTVVYGLTLERRSLAAQFSVRISISQFGFILLSFVPG